MVDISPESHSKIMGNRGHKSISRARALLDRELSKGKYPSLRRGDPSGTTDREDIMSASKFFFVVEERSSGDSTKSVARRSSVATAAAAASGVVGRTVTAGDDNSMVTSPSTGAVLPYPWVVNNAPPASDDGRRQYSSNAQRSGGDSGGPVGASKPNKKGFGSLLGNRTGDAGEKRGSGETEGDHRRGGNNNEYTVPYWTILSVGEDKSTLDDSEDPSVIAGFFAGGRGGKAITRKGGGGGGTTGKAPPPRRRVVTSQFNVPSEPPLKVYPPIRSKNEVGYRIVVVPIEVSVYHPKGSAVAANRDAVVAGLTRVRKVRKSKHSSLTLRMPVSCEVVFEQRNFFRC